MSYYPDFALFSRLAQDAQLVPVYRRLMADSLTPVSAFHLLDEGPSACLFESVVGGEKVGRYSFLAAQPFLQIEAYGQRMTVTSAETNEEFDSPDPLAELKARIDSLRAVRLPELPPFTSGAVGYAGYDVVRYTENLPSAPHDDRLLPDLSFAFYDQMVVFDNITKTIIVVAMARLGDGDSRADCKNIRGVSDADRASGRSGAPGSASARQQPDPNQQRIDPRAAYADAQRCVDAIVAKLSLSVPDLTPVDIDVGGDPKIVARSNFTQTEYEAAVGKCVEYIRAGDIFQVVISQRIELDIKSPPFEIYRTLRIVNPSPFMFYLRTPSVTLVGSSPEVMVRVLDGRVTVRPLAGTRKRGRTEADDKLLAEELLADPKERAEHVMLVDLGRNDVGRVARYRSVELTDVMTIERYSHVMHITSNVTGQLAEGRDCFDALKACLPAGTVSGAPKVRAMQIIDELEPTRRGPYAGAVGYIDFAGNMDTCIALRTIVVQGEKAYVQAGAGIVADSEPSAEYQETLNKARGLLKAIEITEARVRK